MQEKLQKRINLFIVCEKNIIFVIRIKLNLLKVIIN